MPRLIDADKLKEHYSWWEGGSQEMTFDRAKQIFDTIVDVQQTVDAERHGRWQKKRNPMMYQIVPYVYVCDQCGTAFEYDTPYCGECGAKMDEVEA